jgi:Xaa-Pro aminopeptidase
MNNTTTTTETLGARRSALRAATPGWTLVLPSGRQSMRNATVGNPFRHDADYFYLTGLDEPDGCLVMRPDREPVLYVPEPSPEHARWVGRQTTLSQAAAQSGLADVRPAAMLAGELADHAAAGEVLGFRLGEDPALDARVLECLLDASRSRRTGRVRKTVSDPHGPIGRLRAVKDPGELAAMRAAARLSTEAHVHLLRSARAGESGAALAARLEGACRAAGAVRMAYNTIVARGAEACCLHASPSHAAIGAGELVLVDAGCELAGYACDLTRTWPAEARFSDAQAALYDAVLDAQRAALAAVRPGATLRAVHDAALDVLRSRCGRLGLAGDVARWFPHDTSHWIGLDVHDAGPYLAADGQPVTLVPGMTFTVEPGLYVDPDDRDAPAALRGVGVRIEDTVAVTADGVEVLTAAAPKTRAELEAQRAAAG